MSDVEERLRDLRGWHASIAERGAATVERYALRAGRGVFTATNAAGVEEVSNLVDEHGAAAALLTEAADEIARLGGEVEGRDNTIDALEFLKKQAESRASTAEAERDEARGWVRWLVRNAKDERLTVEERVGIVAHFPADEYPPHPAEALLSEVVGVLEPFAAWAGWYKRGSDPDALNRPTKAHYVKAASLLTRIKGTIHE